MKFTSISEIDNFNRGESVPSISGTVTKVGVRKAATNHKGPYSLQQITVNDDSGEIDISVFNHRDLRAMLNKGVDIEGGLFVEEYNGTKRLKASEKNYINGSQGAEPQAESFSGGRQSGSGSGGGRESARGLKYNLLKHAVAYIECFDASAAIALEIERRHGVYLGSVAIGITAERLWQQSIRDNVIDTVTPKPLDQVEQKVARLEAYMQRYGAHIARMKKFAEDAARGVMPEHDPATDSDWTDGPQFETEPEEDPREPF